MVSTHTQTWHLPLIFLDCLKCLVPLNSLAVLVLSAGLYLANYLQEQENCITKQQKWPRNGRNIANNCFGKCSIVCSFFKYRALLCYTYAHTSPPPFLFCISSSPSCLQNDAPSILNTTLSISLTSPWISWVLPLLQSRKECFVFFRVHQFQCGSMYTA